MKNKITGICLIFCLYLSVQTAFADSVDVNISRPQVTMESSQMAKNIDNMAKKFKESYSKTEDSSSQSETEDSSLMNNDIFDRQIEPKQYESDWR